MNNVSKEREEEILLAISLWRESGLSQGAFCRREKIARSTFQSWRKKYDSAAYFNHSESKSSTEGFLSVELNSSDTIITSPTKVIEICYPNQVIVKCDITLESDDLQKLISLPIN